MKKSSASGKAFKHTVLEGVFPLLEKKINHISNEIIRVSEAFFQDQELTGKSLVQAYFKLMAGSAEALLCAAKNSMCIISSKLLAYDAVNPQQAHEINRLLDDIMHSLASAKASLEKMHSIIEMKEVLFEVYSHGSDLAS